MTPTVDGKYIDPNEISEEPLDEKQRIYKENILDHYRNPRNKKKMRDPDRHAKDKNPFCGDVIEVFLLTRDGKIEDVSWQGQGCAISQASMSMLSRKLKGLSAEDVNEIGQEYVLDMLGIPIGIVRRKCAMLGLRVTQKALEEYHEA